MKEIQGAVWNPFDETWNAAVFKEGGPAPEGTVEIKCLSGKLVGRLPETMVGKDNAIAMVGHPLDRGMKPFLVRVLSVNKVKSNGIYHLNDAKPND